MNTVVTAALPALLECTHGHARLVMPEAGLRADVLTLAMLLFTARHEGWDGTPQPRLYDQQPGRTASRSRMARSTPSTCPIIPHFGRARDSR